MKATTFLKSGIGLIYTTVLMAAVYFGIIWLTQYIVNLSWTGALIFWIVGAPIVIGLSQAIASLAAIPTAYLMKGAKWMGWLLVVPVLYFMISYGAILWHVASSVGGLLVWLLMISWFGETAWLFIAYLYIAIGSAYEEQSLATA